MHSPELISSEESTDFSDEIFKKLNQIYDDLLENSIDFDPEFAHILYDNLWDMYDD